MWRRSIVLWAATPLLSAGAAFAQTPPGAAPAAPAAPPPAAVHPAAPAPAATPAAAPAAPVAAPAAPAAEAKPPEPKWYEKIKADAFVDAYASINYNSPKPETGGNLFHAYDASNGFSLHWAGLNLSYGPDPVGATISLRFGPGAEIHCAGDRAAGLTNVKQAFATWRPGGEKGKLTFDFGKFDQPFGSEVADSQGNINYTRSALYWLAQPLFFTGLRVDYAPVDWLDVKLILANGWNNSIDNNRGKTGAVQVNLKPNDKLLVALGYALGPEQPDYTAPVIVGGQGADNPNADGRFRHLIDLVVDFNPTDKLRLLLNGDYGQEDLGNQTVHWYGANLAARYAAGSGFAAALRGGILADPDGFAGSGLIAPSATYKDMKLVDGTVTLEYAPVSNLIMKLEQRFDWASVAGDRAIFPSGVGNAEKTQMQTIFGVVATTN